MCLCAAAQEQSKGPTAHEQERKAYDEIYSTKRGMLAPSRMPLWYGRSRAASLGALWTVAMGQGGNALWLASKGWAVTGFDISTVAIDERAQGG